MTSLPSPADVADALLECSVVGSFTKVGFSIRSRIADWAGELADLTGQTAVVTGATSGIGKATARGLLELGADVILTSRSDERANATAAGLNQLGHRGTATGFALDTSDFASINNFVGEVAYHSGNLDMLLHNAGALLGDYQTDDRGMEVTLSSHLVGPYLLTRLCEPLMPRGARVIFMSSGGMYTQGLEVEHIELSEQNYKGAVAYARAKRGQVEMVSHLAPQLAPDIIMHAMHPGWVDTPGVDAGLPGFGKVMGPLLRDADQGADTMVWLAATAAHGAAPGQFWLDREPRRTVYIPGTGTTRAERQRLMRWLDDQIEPGLPR